MTTTEPDKNLTCEHERVEAMWNPGLGVIVVRNTASGDEVKFSEEAWWAFIASVPAELTDSERFQVGEARRMLTAFAAERLGEGIYRTERTLHDQARNLLDLIDRIAPEETADA